MPNVNHNADSPSPEVLRDVLLAKALYTTYCSSVGGRAYNGDLLPRADDFFGDGTKAVQVKAWIDVAVAARSILQTTRD